MTDNNDNSEFESYLKGDDELSRTYRELEQESSPAQLDSLILKAAHESVNQKSQANDGYFSTKYSIAASLCACVLITSLYLSDQRPKQETTPTIAFDSFVLESTPQETSESIQTDTLIELDQAAASPPVNEVLLGDISNSLQLADDSELVVASRSRQLNENRRPETAINEEFIQYTPPVLDIELTTTAITLPEDQQPPIISTEEVVVTSLFSTNTSSLFGETAFDEETTLWIEEIYFLNDEIDELTFLIEEESSDFSDIFPEINLEAALQQHELSRINDLSNGPARLVGIDAVTEEIIVTGSRLRDSGNLNEPDIQNTADYLIEEIYSLGVELNLLKSELQDERNGFSNQHPEIDVDEALLNFTP